MSVVVYHVEVSGKTFHIRETLKNLGLWWDSEKKLWKGAISEWDLMKLRKLADKYQIEVKAERRELRSGRSSSTYVRCWECGRLVPREQAVKDADGGWYCGC